jgi:hypothetical protein
MAAEATNRSENAPSWVEDVVRRMQEVVERQDTQIQQQSAQIQSLEQQLQQQRQARTAEPRHQAPTATIGESLTPRTDPTETESTAVRKAELLPKPPEFSGERSEFRSWLTQMHAKLLVDKAHESEIVRFWYMHSRLRGKALTQVESWVVAAQAAGTLSVDDLVGRLRAAYDDPESAERASRKLNVMRQGGKPFTTFLAEFDRTILDAGGIAWTDQVKKTFLSNCLAPELKTALVATPAPKSYEAYCSLLQTVSCNLEALQKDKRHRATTAHTVTEETPTHDTMDWEPVQVSIATARMQRARWVGQDVLDKRRKNEQCLRCESEEHFVRDCPLLPAIRPRGPRVKPQGVSAAAVTVKEGSEESGKE